MGNWGSIQPATASGAAALSAATTGTATSPGQKSGLLHGRHPNMATSNIVLDVSVGGGPSDSTDRVSLGRSIFRRNWSSSWQVELPAVLARRMIDATAGTRWGDVPLFAALLLCAVTVRADYDAGRAAWQAARHVEAVKEWRAAARANTPGRCWRSAAPSPGGSAPRRTSSRRTNGSTLPPGWAAPRRRPSATSWRRR